MKLLSKSSYMLGLQCPLYLWTKFNGTLPTVDSSTQYRFDEGHVVGALAKAYFGGGVDIPSDNFKLNIDRTAKLINSGKILFEPGFLVNNLFSRIDVLKPVKDGFDLIEVKSSTKVKPEHIQDVSFQRHICALAGIKINKCYLMHIKKDFVKDGDIDPKKYFRLVDITTKVDEVTEGIDDRIEAMFTIIKGKKPSICVGGHCHSPYACPIEDCWKGLPLSNVFDLYRGGRKCDQLFNDGIIEIKDIPDEFKLTGHQSIQRDCAVSGKVHVHKEKIKHFLNSLKEPVSYLDFETFTMAVPIYDGTKPYQQIPFQFSLHVGKEHHGFIATGAEDPRLRFLEELKKVLPTTGVVVVYSQSFEESRLNECAEAFPEYKQWVDKVVARMVDLLIPFRNFSYYNPKQNGSASIKAVLPAMTGKQHYKKLAIDNGGDASLAYLKMYHSSEEVDIEKTRLDLEKYCELDTLAMMVLVDGLRELVK